MIKMAKIEELDMAKLSGICAEMLDKNQSKVEVDGMSIQIIQTRDSYVDTSVFAGIK